MTANYSYNVYINSWLITKGADTRDLRVRDEPYYFPKEKVALMLKVYFLFNFNLKNKLT